MTLFEQGRIEGGAIVLAKPLPLPEGTEVTVRIETASGPTASSDASGSEEFASLPFFGMWANREDLADTVAWVRREREQWQQRVSPRG